MRITDAPGWIVLSALGLALLGGGPAGPARAGDDPFLKMEMRSEIEIDLRQVVEDMVPPLLEAAAIGDEEAGARLRGMLELLGIEALDRLEDETVYGAKGGRSSTVIRLGDEAPDGLLARMTAMRAGRVRFARYLPREEVALLVALTNLPESLEAVLEILASPHLAPRTELLGEDEEGRPALGGVALEDIATLLPLLSGELDLVVLSGELDPLMPIPPVILVAGARDGTALRDRLLAVLIGRFGEDLAAMLDELPGETAGDFTVFTLPMGIGYAVSDDYLIVASCAERLPGLLARPDGNMDQVAALRYVHADGDLLAPLLLSLSAAGRHGGGPVDPMHAVLARALEEGPIGTAELVLNVRPGRIEMELEFPGTLVGLQYRVYRAMMGEAPGMARKTVQEGRYRADVATIDAAMTLYGVEHDGVFPERLEQLVEEEYLDELPELRPTPLGVYRPGGSTYVPLRDVDGVVVGYYFLVFGDHPHDGYDVFTPGNTRDPDRYRMAWDGIPDGVVAFSYDGIAIEQVEAWRGE